MKNKHKPFFTIGIPTFNRANYLKLAIKSVLNQTFKDYEILIVDNHSGDNTERIVKTYTSQYKNISYIRNKKNLGSPRNIKNLFSNAKGEYLFILCDDDLILKPTTLTQIHKVINRCHPGFLKLEALFYNKSFDRIAKCFKFSNKTGIIKPHDNRYIEKIFNYCIEFWSGSIYKIDTKSLHLINTREWIYTTLDYTYYLVKNFGAVIIEGFPIFGRYNETTNLTNLIEPILSLDTMLSVIAKYSSQEKFVKLDQRLRKEALFSIVNFKLYVTRRQYLIYMYKIFIKDRYPLNKFHYYFFGLFVFLIPKLFFELFKKYIYHPMLKKEAYTYISNNNLKNNLRYWINYDK